MQHPILTAREAYAKAGPECPGADRAHACYPSALAEVLPLPRRGEVLKRGEGIRAVARINYGRWIVDCPFCSSSQVGDPADPRFFCAGVDGCANSGVLGAYVPVDYPEPRLRRALEHVAGARLRREHVNWEPGELLDDLLVQNEALAAQGLARAVPPEEVKP